MKKWFVLFNTVELYPIGVHEDFDGAEDEHIKQGFFEGPDWIMNEDDLRCLRDNITKLIDFGETE